MLISKIVSGGQTGVDRGAFQNEKPGLLTYFLILGNRSPLGSVSYRCKTAAPTEGFDEVRLVLSSDSCIISIVGVLRPGDKAVCERKAKELAAKYKAELSKRETAAGAMVFEVRHGNAVEVELASAATKPLSDKASAPAW